MNKVTSTALLLMLALANAGLDYSAVCVFLDVDPFGTFSPNNFFAGLVAVAQSLLLIILPWVASEKIAAGEKGPAACAIIGSLFVAMAGAFLRATTEAASTTTSVSGEVVSGLSIDGMAFVLIMAGIALGEAIAAFLIKSLDIRAEAEALQAEIERMRIIEDHIDEDIATAARVALAAGRQSIAAAKGSCEQVFQQLVAKSDDSHNCFIGFVDEIEAQRNAEREQFAKLSAEFDARIAKKFPGAIATAQKAPPRPKVQKLQRRMRQRPTVPARAATPRLTPTSQPPTRPAPASKPMPKSRARRAKPRLTSTKPPPTIPPTTP